MCVSLPFQIDNEKQDSKKHEIKPEMIAEEGSCGHGGCEQTEAREGEAAMALEKGEQGNGEGEGGDQ